MSTHLSKTLFLITISLISGCASVVSKHRWPVTFNSQPSGAEISITNRRGFVVYRGKTPADILLNSGSKYFSREHYIITMKMDGYQTQEVELRYKVNGWYWGNFFIGLLGFLIVDPITGAMYKPETSAFDITLDSNNSNGKNAHLRIIDYRLLTEGQKKMLTKIE